MTTFTYLRPGTINEVCSLLTAHGPEASLLAGGTDLLVRIRMGKSVPRVVVDLKRVTDMAADMTQTDSGIRIGALMTLDELVANPVIAEQYPALAEALVTVGSVQIRNRATLAGNLCNASPAADTAPPLLIYNASVHVAGSGGVRTVPLEQFFTGPGQTVLQRGELLTAIELPAPTQPVGAAFVRLSRRAGIDLATVSVAALLTHTGEIRISLGAVAPTPLLVTAGPGTLSPWPVGSQAWEPILAQLSDPARPIDDLRGSREYRQAMLLVLIRRALERARGRLEEKGGWKS